MLKCTQSPSSAAAAAAEAWTALKERKSVWQNRINLNVLAHTIHAHIIYRHTQTYTKPIVTGTVCQGL